MRFWHLAFTAGSLLCVGCAPNRAIRQQLIQAEKDFNDHIGFVLADPSQKKTLIEYQGDRFFTPASNTKILTLYSCLRLLGDSIPALNYAEQNDSLIFWGTGDPGFLYGNVMNSEKVTRFLSGHPSRLFYYPGNFQAEYFGPGWAWGDYKYAYQVERTAMPVYGNRFKLKKSPDGFSTVPSRFQNEIWVGENRTDTDPLRELQSNKVTYFPDGSINGEWTIPIHFSNETLTSLLKDTVKKDVTLAPRPRGERKTLYSFAADSLYRVMMQESDNFIAEQLLLVCSGVLSDTLDGAITIREVRKRFLTDLPDSLMWVDGSGLSRYNLFTPRSIVALWQKLDLLVPRERLLSLVAVGGRSGTLRNAYKSESPWIFGKTGTLRNNHALSGFLVTKKGRTLLFCWMNNNFATSSSDVRGRMETVLRSIYEKY